ncbi:hypothetical protein BACCIP111899_01598 [Bacillus rhizoplanae]|uniref:Uncharacterized protein n=1 Tax=Bacillus rhizoplanae TaxID=2880966 RepID=A0ABM8Y9R2_9BACI|nr:replication-relaxation family protein [Bacillus rhizoplanae]CAG9612422.1 hypothetical protein BACCIP111899_01598 [Bacillus rhizoplanae]
MLHELGSVRNAQRIMKELEEYVSSFRDGENVYYLNKHGRDRVDCKKRRAKTNQCRHFIMRNDVYIAFGCPGDWKTEIRLGVKGEISVVCDAIFKKNGQYHIVEVDFLQKMAANRMKIKKYRKMIELGVFDKPPKFIWMTTTEYRRREIAQLCIELDTVIFTVGDFH